MQFIFWKMEVPDVGYIMKLITSGVLLYEANRDQLSNCSDTPDLLLLRENV